MDKETLSNYGWIVICILVLVVMIAFAGPFGNFVADAVKSTTQGLFDVNKGALDAAGIEIDDQKFLNPELNPNDGTTPQDGDVYVCGDYEYMYNMRWMDDGWYDYSSLSEGINMGQNGWGVRIIDKTKTTYGPILESINGIPVTNATALFKDCTSLTTAPVIPSSMVDIWCAFDGCTNLKTYVGSTDPDGDFSGYVIPNGITNMARTFAGCTSLTTAPIIPNTVCLISNTFVGCTSLSGTVVINTNNIHTANPVGWFGCSNCFKNLDMTNITLTGEASKDVLNLIGGTGNNWTPIE